MKRGEDELNGRRKRRNAFLDRMVAWL